MKPTYEELVQALLDSQALAIFYSDLSDTHNCISYHEADMSEEEIEAESTDRQQKWKRIATTLAKIEGNE